MWGNFASFFVCFHRRFLISKSNFKFGRGRTDILEITLLAMNQINNIRWIAREFLPNKICFTRLCAREGLRVDQEVLTKIASGFVTSETPRWWQCNRLWWALNSIISSFRRSKNLKEILAPSKCRKGSPESITFFFFDFFFFSHKYFLYIYLPKTIP